MCKIFYELIVEYFVNFPTIYSFSFNYVPFTKNNFPIFFSIMIKKIISLGILLLGEWFMELEWDNMSLIWIKW